MVVLEKNNPIWNFKEVHKSGTEPSTWVCGWCGKKLEDVHHYVGMTHGIRYCDRCMKNGKADRDVEKLDDDKLVNHKEIYYGKPAEKNFRIRRL